MCYLAIFLPLEKFRTKGGPKKKKKKTLSLDLCKVISLWTGESTYPLCPFHLGGGVLRTEDLGEGDVNDGLHPPVSSMPGLTWNAFSQASGSRAKPTPVVISTGLLLCLSHRADTIIPTASHPSGSGGHGCRVRWSHSTTALLSKGLRYL